jgi:hypothetical protein
VGPLDEGVGLRLSAAHKGQSLGRDDAHRWPLVSHLELGIEGAFLQIAGYADIQRAREAAHDVRTVATAMRIGIHARGRDSSTPPRHSARLRSE